MHIILKCDNKTSLYVLLNHMFTLSELQRTALVLYAICLNIFLDQKCFAIEIQACIFPSWLDYTVKSGKRYFFMKDDAMIFSLSVWMIKEWKEWKWVVSQGTSMQDGVLYFKGSCSSDVFYIKRKYGHLCSNLKNLFLLWAEKNITLRCRQKTIECVCRYTRNCCIKILNHQNPPDFKFDYESHIPPKSLNVYRTCRAEQSWTKHDSFLLLPQVDFFF